MAAVRHLGFVMRTFGLLSKKAFSGLYHCAKFGWNRLSTQQFRSYASFNIVRVWLFGPVQYDTAQNIEDVPKSGR